MKTRLLAILFLTLGLILTLFWTGAAQEGEPITLSINLVTEPPTLDPALATDTTSSSVIEQLFIGGQVLHEQRLESGIVALCWAQPQSGKYALGVGVNDEYRLVCGVEDY